MFVLDWSGSMCDVMLDTIKQLYNLMWFCKKVSIPFEVYAFTNDYPHVRTDENGKVTVRDLAYQKREGLVYVGEWFSMMNLFTSKVDAKTLEYQMKKIFFELLVLSGIIGIVNIPLLLVWVCLHSFE